MINGLLLHAFHPRSVKSCPNIKRTNSVAVNGKHLKQKRYVSYHDIPINFDIKQGE